MLLASYWFLKGSDHQTRIRIIAERFLVITVGLDQSWR